MTTSSAVDLSQPGSRKWGRVLDSQGGTNAEYGVLVAAIPHDRGG